MVELGLKGNKMKSLTKQQAIDANFNDDIIDSYDTICDCGRKADIVEATIDELAAQGYGTECGTVGNICFKGIALRYGNVKIRTCLEPAAKTASTSEIFIFNQRMGYGIQSLASKHGGSLRFENPGEFPCWAYFETE